MKRFTYFAVAFISFCSVLQAEACSQALALKAAREHVTKNSPKGSKVSVRSIKDSIFYTAVLLDEYGANAEVGKLKVVTGGKGDCEITQLQKSISTTNASTAISAPIPTQKKNDLNSILKK